MPDRFVFSAVETDTLEDSPLPDDFDGLHYNGGLERLLGDLEATYSRELLGACTNVKPGEDDDAATYFLERVTGDRLGGNREQFDIVACTCKAFRYQQIPSADNVKAGAVGLSGIGGCKHVHEYKKRTREYADRDDSQQDLVEHLGLDAGDDGGQA